jgi:hypothetical protein
MTSPSTGANVRRNPFAASTNLRTGLRRRPRSVLTNNGGDDLFFVAIDKLAAAVKPRFDVVVHGGFDLQYESARRASTACGVAGCSRWRRSAGSRARSNHSARAGRRSTGG